MAERDIRETALEGFTVLAQRSPAIALIALQAFIIIGLATWLISDAKNERKEYTQRIEELHDELVACYRLRDVTRPTPRTPRTPDR